MKFNINDHVYVKLTEHGKQIVHHCLGMSTVSSDLKENENGLSRWQLWRLMAVFGPHLHMGMSNMPFEHNEIMIEIPIETLVETPS